MYMDFRKFYMSYIPRSPPTTYTDLFDDYMKKLSSSRKRGKIDTRDLPIIRRCDTTSVEEIRLKDGVIAKLNSRVFKLEAIIKVLGRERKGVSLDKSCVAEIFNNFSSGCWEELNEEFNELCETKFCVNGPAMIDLDSDEDLVKEYLIQEESRLKQEEEERCRLEEHKMMKALFLKTLQEEVQRRDEKEKMLKYEEEKKKRRHELMNSDHWKLSVSKISNGKRTQRSNVTPWVKDLSRYNRATDKVHLTDAFDIFLGRQGPLRCRFPWCKDHVELWVNYMWHFRPHDADWAMVGAYFVQLLLQDSIPSWYADGSLYKVSWYDVEEVFMPINETNQHWCLAHLHIRTGLVTFYDSGLTYDLEWRECYMRNVNHNFNSTPLNTNLNFSSVFPIATCDGLWCFSYADNFMAIIWNPSIMKSIAVFIPYFTSQVETQRIVLGFGVRPDNLDPTLLKISYPYSGEGTWFVSLYTLSTDRWRRLQNLPSQTLRIKNSGQVVVGNFIYWAASDRCGLHDDGVMHTSYVLVSFDMINHQFQIIVIPEPLLVWLVAPFCITQLGNNLVLSANYHVGHSRLLCAWVLEVNGHAVTSYRMIVSVPTPYSSRLLGFNMDEEPIIEVDEIGYQMDTTLQVYNRTHEQFQNLGVEANPGPFFIGAFKESLILSNETDHSFHPCAKIPEVMMQAKPGTDDRGCGYFMWMDDFMNRISSSGPSTPPTLYTCPSTRPSYFAGTSRSAMNVEKAECSNCKFMAEKIKTLEAKIKILEGTLEMERHPENHTIESAAILHELYNDMGKLGLE
ncbi:F-box domain containing protein [Tanacetum coccineum]